MMRLGLTLLAAGMLLLTACSVVEHRPSGPPPEQVAPVAPPAAPSRDLTAIPDAIPHFEPRSKFGNPPFYYVLGRRYFVLPTADGYVERGVASWYGPTFHGLNTADGEPYDMYGMTAAHKTLPLPAYARVTNLRNGKSVVVRINDRGPFVANRLIDLSYSAAAKLDMLREGTTLVEVRALTPGQPASDKLTRAALSPPPTLFVQVGAFREESNAQHLVKRLHEAGFAGAFVLSPPEPHRLFRVRVGPVATVAQYDELTARLSKIGIESARLALD